MRLKALVLVAIFLCAPFALADTFTMTATGAGNSITLVATLTGTASGTPGVFFLSGMTGTVNGVAIDYLLATASPGAVTNSPVVNNWYITYDNVLNMNSPFFDLYGLGFLLIDGTLVNVYFQNGYLYADLGNNPPQPWEQVNVSVAALPEPASLLLFGSGLIALGIGFRKRLSSRSVNASN